MTAAPSKAVRKAVFDRDQHRCMAAGTECYGKIEWQHRESAGMGGHGSNRDPVTAEDGIALCAFHNAVAEAGGQERALHHGWKIRRFRGGLLSREIPYLDTTDGTFYLPVGVERVPIRAALAQELLEVAGAYTRKLTA